MPRDGSQHPPAGASTAPVAIGEIADPPYAVVPEPAALFGRRAARFRQLAARGGEVAPYLAFLAQLAEAQAAGIAGLAPPRLPDERALALAGEHGMPPLGAVSLEADPVAVATLDALIAGLDDASVPDSARQALDALVRATPIERAAMLQAVLDGDIPESRIAEHVFAAAALQVHFARLAAGLDPESLKKITDGACPACGGPPVASSVVNWEGAANSRFCACATCGTQWHVPRVRCLSCGGEKDITFHSVEGGDEAVKAETCRGCRSYLKIVYQPKDRDVEPLADDVASLALDVLMAREGYTRSGSNPFLVGY